MKSIINYIYYISYNKYIITITTTSNRFCLAVKKGLDVYIFKCNYDISFMTAFSFSSRVFNPPTASTMPSFLVAYSMTAWILLN